MKIYSSHWRGRLQARKHISIPVTFFCIIIASLACSCGLPTSLQAALLRFKDTLQILPSVHHMYPTLADLSMSKKWQCRNLEASSSCVSTARNWARFVGNGWVLLQANIWKVINQVMQWVYAKPEYKYEEWKYEVILELTSVINFEVSKSADSDMELTYSTTDSNL